MSLAQTQNTQHSVHLTGGYAPRFQAFSLAQASSAKMALSRPARQQVTHAVGQHLLCVSIIEQSLFDIP